jgi:phage terminase Nu1 subunit (DNA packaging protein)
MEKEPGKLMSRMINPLPRKQALEAATEVCKQYPTIEEKRVRTLTMSELTAEDADCQRLKKEDELERIRMGAESPFAGFHARANCSAVRREIESRTDATRRL